MQEGRFWSLGPDCVPLSPIRYQSAAEDLLHQIEVQLRRDTTLWLCVDRKDNRLGRML